MWFPGECVTRRGLKTGFITGKHGSKSEFQMFNFLISFFFTFNIKCGSLRLFSIFQVYHRFSALIKAIRVQSFTLKQEILSYFLNSLFGNSTLEGIIKYIFHYNVKFFQNISHNYTTTYHITVKLSIFISKFSTKAKDRLVYYNLKVVWKINIPISGHSREQNKQIKIYSGGKNEVKYIKNHVTWIILQLKTWNFQTNLYFVHIFKIQSILFLQINKFN